MEKLLDVEAIVNGEPSAVAEACARLGERQEGCSKVALHPHAA